MRRGLLLLGLSGCWVTGAELSVKLTRAEPDTLVHRETDAGQETDEPSDRDSSSADSAGDTEVLQPECLSGELGAASGTQLAQGSLTGSSDDFQPVCLVGSSGADWAFGWRAPEAGCWRFHTTGSTYDTVLSLQSSCEGEVLACNDDTPEGGVASSVSHLFEADQAAVVVIDAARPEASGAFSLSVEVTSPVPFDLDAGRVVGMEVAHGTTAEADTTLAPAGDSCPFGPGGADTLVRWRAPSAGDWQIALTGTFDQVLAVYSACSAEVLVCVDANPLWSEMVTVSAYSGEAFVIRVAGYENSSGEIRTGDWALRITSL